MKDAMTLNFEINGRAMGLYLALDHVTVIDHPLYRQLSRVDRSERGFFPNFTPRSAERNSSVISSPAGERLKCIYIDS